MSHHHRHHHAESNSENQSLGSQTDNGQAISLAGNDALRSTTLQEFTSLRDAGKTLDPSLVPNLTIEGLSNSGNSAKDSSRVSPINIVDTFNDYKDGKTDLTDTRKALRQADRAIYGRLGGDADGPEGTNDQQPLGDVQGRKDLREARRELKEAKKHFKELLRDVGDADGAQEIREGIRDLRKVDREIAKAIRNDKAFDQPGARTHIKEALALLDGENSSHIDNKGRVRGDHSAFEINQGYNKVQQSITHSELFT